MAKKMDWWAILLIVIGSLLLLLMVYFVIRYKNTTRENRLIKVNKRKKVNLKMENPVTRYS